MTLNILTAYAKILGTAKPFYADEFGINGGTMSALAYDGLVKETGNTKEIMIQLNSWDGDIYKKCTVKEWVTVRNSYVKRVMEKEVKKARAFVELYDKNVKGIL